jgi:polar amino acid transport system substrate-binding protein
MFGKSLLFIVALMFVSVNSSAQNVSEPEVIKLVNTTCKALQADFPGTVAKINAAAHPYTSEKDKSFYSFVYDMLLVMVAHPKKDLLNQNLANKPDVEGVCFRDLMVEGARKNKSGWQDYAYQKPGETGIECKKSYYELCRVNDRDYVVVSGIYAGKKPPCHPANKITGCKK